MPLLSPASFDSELSSAPLGFEVPGLQPGPKASDGIPLCGGSPCPSDTPMTTSMWSLFICVSSLALNWAQATIHTCQMTSPLQSLLSLKYILSLLPGLEDEMATHSSTLVWKIPWTEKSGGRQFMGLQELDMT